MTVDDLQIGKYNNNSSSNNKYSNDNIVKNTEYINRQTRELYQMVDSHKELYSQTMLAGFMWSVLAASMAYYVFTEDNI
jgi:hypothetical protein